MSKTIVLSLSGTVGAARAAALRGLPALATSQGLPSPGGSWGYEANAEIVVAWIDEFRRAVLEEEVDAWNLNVPGCQEGEIRGVVEAEVAGSGDGAFSTQDCESDLQNPTTDVEALNNGFAVFTPIPLETSLVGGTPIGRK